MKQCTKDVKHAFIASESLRMIFLGLFLQTDEIIFPYQGWEDRGREFQSNRDAFNLLHVQETFLSAVFSGQRKSDLWDLTKERVRHSHSSLTCTVMLDFPLTSKVLLLTTFHSSFPIALFELLFPECYSFTGWEWRCWHRPVIKGQPYLSHWVVGAIAGLWQV